MKTWLLITLLTILSLNATAENISVFRKSHAKELMGPKYGRKIASIDLQHDDMYELVLKKSKQYLPKKFKFQAETITKTIITQSIKYQYDPMFLMAMIMNESSFNPIVQGTSGEIGLMQILPSTGKWLSEKYKMKWSGKKTLEDPVANIKLGAAYVNMLRAKYDNHGRLYLAAYNMGPGNLRKALRKKIWPKDYPVAVMKRYIDLYKKI